MISIRERDSKGRFLGRNHRQIAAAIAAENDLAQKIAKTAALLGLKPEDLGVKQLASGNWHVGYVAKIRLSNLILSLLNL